MRLMIMTLILLAAGAKIVRAGELFTESFSLDEAYDSTLQVVLATVLETNADTNELKAKALKAWPAAAAKYTAGQDYAFPIYAGIKWTDPNESPIEKRLADSTRLEKVKAGQKMLIVSRGAAFELLPATKGNLRKVEALFKKNNAGK